MTQQYKYTLDRSSKKHQCPSCNKKSFVRFIDSETKQYTNSFDGRCDRESKCGYFKKPNTNKRITSSIISNTKRITPTYHSLSMVIQYMSNFKQNNFIAYLLTHFVPVDVIQAIKLYKIGTTNHWNGATIFWQIDNCRTVRAGKIMLYNSNTGKRVKKPYNHINWMHKSIKQHDFVLQQCLFGLHCITKQENYKIICIVESEKTAIIMSIIYPSNIWMATGSKSNFKEELLTPIKHRKIIVYPDKSEFDKWNTVSLELEKKGYNIECSRMLEESSLKDGGDLVDLVV
ncbi:DUF6371 domain-containing protein [Lacinutrix jangbogonensis]|uniref:DUF6371 domain-containing protein n=1 Tax=Lacinutrix jangbogonensis TaxID=1469557 RepID=UPI00053D9A0C|nr:DUF6371 domain-containing protein [Lacinutrix jangbogonensis]